MEPDTEAAQTEAIRLCMVIAGQLPNSEKLTFWLWMRDSVQGRIEFEKSIIEGMSDSLMGSK